MSTKPNEPGKEGFVPGQHYKFDPPVETNCASVVPGSAWERKSFAEGWCLKYDERVNCFAFQGEPIGEQIEYFFIVAWGKGSVAENTSPPKLHVVK